jgi:hypothetical protein
VHLVSQHKDNKITRRELKDLALDRNLIYVGKKDSQDEEEHSDQAAYMALNKNLIEPLMEWKFISVEKIGARHIVSLTDIKYTPLPTTFSTPNSISDLFTEGELGGRAGIGAVTFDSKCNCHL